MLTNNETFTTDILPSGLQITILEGKGIHVFNALNNASKEASTNGNKNSGDGDVIKHLMLQLIYINNKPITEQELNNLSMADMFQLHTAIGAMMQPPYKL